jgi:hypothetical protein
LLVVVYIRMMFLEDAVFNRGSLSTAFVAAAAQVASAKTKSSQSTKKAAEKTCMIILMQLDK